MSLAEKLVWFRLRGRRLKFFRFNRSVRYGSHLIDFFCPSLNIAILIGSSELERLTQRELESRGITVLRFTPTQVFKNFDGVVHAIGRNIQQRFHQQQFIR